MESKVSGDDYDMRFFMCDNYEYDPPKCYGRTNRRYHLELFGLHVQSSISEI